MFIRDPYFPHNGIGSLDVRGPCHRIRVYEGDIRDAEAKPPMGVIPEFTNERVERAWDHIRH
jgi:hypothetical protein